MPTRKDNTNVAPIYREQVFIPASGTTLIKQNARPKINGIPVSSGAIDIVSPEFDLLTGIRGLANMVKPKTYKSIINNTDYNPTISEIDNAVNQGIQMGRDYINHPIVQATSEHNRQLFKRLYGKPQNMIYIDNTGKKVLAKQRGELLSTSLEEPIKYKFAELPHDAGTYIRSMDGSGNITIKKGLDNSKTKLTAFHETLHHGRYGNFDGIIYDIKAEKLYPNNSYLMAGHEAAANTAEVGRDMGLALGQKYPGRQVFRDMLDKLLARPYYKDFVIKDAKLDTNRDYKRLWDALTGKYFTTAGTAATGLNLTNNDKMKCGGRHKAQLGLDIREGGIAIPIANNMFYIEGRKHAAGGVAIGPNNKNGVEVEGGEVVEMIDSNHPSVGRQFKAGGQQQTMRVFSSVPFLRGASPAELVLGGANPDVVFKAQEEFKDRNRINDDGTMYKTGGIYIKPSKRGTFTAAATKHGMGVQEFASKVLANKEDYSPAMVKKANFARNASRWKKEYGGDDTKAAALKRIRNKFTVSGDYDGGMFGGAGAGSVIMAQPEYVTDTITKRYLVPVTQNFNDAFGNAVDAGLDKFIFDNKWYNTKKGNNPNNNAAGAARTQTVYLPVEHKEVRRIKKEYGGSMLYTINGNVKNGLSLRPKAELGKEKKYKHNKIDGYGDSVEIDGKFYRYDSDSGLYLLEDKETVNTNLSKTVYGASSVRHIAYDRQGNRYQRRSDGTLIRVSPKKDDYATSKELEEVVITPEKPKKVENVSITGEKVENGVKKTSTPSIEGKTSVSDYRTGPNAHTIPDFVGEETIKVEETKPVTTNKATINNKKVTTTKPAPASTVEQPSVVRRDEYYSSPRVEGPATPVDETYAARQARGTQAVTEYKTDTNNIDNTKNNDTEGKWIGQYKTTNAGDWIGLGSNLLGSILSYGLTSSAISKTPMPVRPAVMQAAKLKTTYNVEPQLSEIREAEQMNRAAVRRNTASSNTSLAREQRLLNEARGARGTLYGQKENIETQLINQDRLNRQQVGAQNTALYNDYLNRVVGTKQAQNQYRISNVNNLLSGLTGSVNNILGTIESRRATNNTLRAIAAANPNVDARLIGGFDYYIDPIAKKKYNKNQQYVGTING